MKQNIPLIILGMIIIAAVIVGIRKTSTPKPAGALESFAQCLTAKGAIMYGAYWCPHCQNQKELFGDAFKHVNYVECASKENLEKKTCERADVKGYPTWIFADGSRLEGETELDVLSKKTTCALPTEQK